MAPQQPQPPGMTQRKPLLVYFSQEEREALNQAAKRRGTAVSREVRRLLSLALSLTDEELRRLEADRRVLRAEAELKAALAEIQPIKGRAQ